MIDISADLGEGSPGEDEIWPLIDSANVACGGHTGDAASMAIAIEKARTYGVKLGAHPSYPDREHFGRRSLEIDPHVLRDSLVAQITALGPIHHVKPHGALYNDAHANRALAEVIVDAIRRVAPSIAIVAPDHSQMAAAARANGITVIREAFADRRYTAGGALVPRATPGSLLTIDEAAAQAELLASEGVVIANDGSRIPIRFDTICIHADMDHAVERLRAIRARLARD